MTPTTNHRLHSLGALSLTFTGLGWQIVHLATVNPDSAGAGPPPLLLLGGILWYGVARFRIWREGR